MIYGSRGRIEVEGMMEQKDLQSAGFGADMNLAPGVDIIEV